jgi:hypothetical protein
MKMLVAYNGLIRNGQPVILEDVVLPENASLIITVEIPPTKTKARRQGEALKRFLTAIDTEDGIAFTEEDFAALENNRADFGRVVEL